MARLYVKENFPRPVVVALRELGHDVLTIQETIQLQPKEWEIIVSAAGYVTSPPITTAALDCWYHPTQMPGRMQVTIPIALQRDNGSSKQSDK